ncbi:hypothetical protein GF337_01290, partial [candidate division KSB1 bacterium]|nr:hypothetical protein [candidate division KSB1 bacterium]
MRCLVQHIFSLRISFRELLFMACIFFSVFTTTLAQSKANSPVEDLKTKSCVYLATQVPTYMNPPVIDGILDEEIWKYADLDSLLYGGFPDDFESIWTDFSDILVSWRAVWSSQTNRLYVAVEVYDDIKGTFDNANYDENICYPWRDDSIEFFTDGDNLGEYYYPHYDVAQRWRVTGLNHRNLGDYPSSGCHLYDGDDFITAVRYESDSLWFCEAEFTIYDKLPDSPHTLKTGDIIGWDIWYNDSDDEIYNDNLHFYDREQQIGWCYRGICYRDAQFFGEMLLQGKFNSPPTAPTLIFPADGRYLNSAQPELCWEVPVDQDGDSISFRIEIATDADFENHIPGSPFDSRSNEEEFFPTGVVSQQIDSCQFQPSFYLEKGQYWWRVTARDPFEAGPVSITNSFTVDTQAPVIDHFRLLNPHYGKNWYDRIRESTISLEIQYDEKY